MDSELTDKLINRTAGRIPVVKALGGADGIRSAARTLEHELHEAGGGATAKEIAGSIPAVAQLLWRVTRDKNVPRYVRFALPAIAAYMVTPIDLVPDFIPVVGALDDALVAILVVRWMLGKVDRDILRGHWSGSDVMFDVLTGLTHGGQT